MQEARRRRCEADADPHGPGIVRADALRRARLVGRRRLAGTRARGRAGLRQLPGVHPELADLAPHPALGRGRRSASATLARDLGPAVAHAIYFINLATDDPEVYRKSVDTLRDTARNARRLGLAGVVFHVGSHKGQGLDATLPQIATGMRWALDELGDDAWLLLENSAGAGDTIGRDTSDLARVLEAVDHPRVGVCIDTCHVYVSGVDIRDRATADALVEQVDRELGLERLRCLHVNDSAAPLGSNRDRHANIGEGELGPDIGVLLAHPRLQGLPAILETAGPEGKGADRAEIDLARSFHAAALAARASAA